MNVVITLYILLYEISLRFIHVLRFLSFTKEFILIDLIHFYYFSSFSCFIQNSHIFNDIWLLNTYKALSNTIESRFLCVCLKYKHFFFRNIFSARKVKENWTRCRQLTVNGWKFAMKRNFLICRKLNLQCNFVGISIFLLYFFFFEISHSHKMCFYDCFGCNLYSSLLVVGVEENQILYSFHYFFSSICWVVLRSFRNFNIRKR